MAATILRGMWLTSDWEHADGGSACSTVVPVVTEVSTFLLHSPYAAAICLKLYGRQGLGVGRLRKLFGKAFKAKGACPEHHCKASGGLIRHIIIQLEKCGLMEKLDETGVRKVSPAVPSPSLSRTDSSSHQKHTFFPRKYTCEINSCCKLLL